MALNQYSLKKTGLLILTTSRKQSCYGSKHNKIVLLLEGAKSFEWGLRFVCDCLCARVGVRVSVGVACA